MVIKRFFKWLREQEGKTYGKGEYPDEVKWINTTIKHNRIKLPNQLLTIEDVKKLANHTYNLRDRCLIFLLYESGVRIGELLGIKLKDIDYDKYGARITISGKTGSRKIRIIASAPAISNWLLEHPDRESKDAFLFCGIWSNKRGKDIGYNTVRKILIGAAERADIDKPQNPHHYRHSRATDLAKKLTESELCAYMGWVQGSKEASTYVHLSGRDTDRAILRIHDLIEDDIEEDKFNLINCPRCKINNDPGAKFCRSCSLGIDERSIIEYDKKKEDSVVEVEKLREQVKHMEVVLKKINDGYMEVLDKQQEEEQSRKEILDSIPDYKGTLKTKKGKVIKYSQKMWHEE